MNKKLLAAAVATAFAAPVAMAQTNVTIYGSFNPQVGSIQASDGRTDGGVLVQGHPSRMNIGQLGGSHIGFRGSEALGGGMSFVWQLETGIGMDGSGGQTFGGRDTFFGLSSGFGTLTFGHISTPFSTLLTSTVAMGSVFGALGPTGAVSIMTNAGPPIGGLPAFSTTPTTFQSTFFRREGSAVQYVSPTFGGGFTARLLMSANEAKVNSAGAIPAGAGATVTGVIPGGANPFIWSASLTYAAGPVLVGFVYDRHNDLRWSGTTTLDNHGWMLAGRWTSGPFLVSAGYTRQTWEVMPAGFAKQDLTSSAWMINGQYSTGPHRFRIGYGERGAGSNIAGVGAGTSLCVQFVCAGNSNIVVGGVTHTGVKSNQFNLGYGYALSKRTEVFAYYSRLNNDAVARANLVGGHWPSLAGAGSDITAFGGGFRHSF